MDSKGLCAEMWARIEYILQNSSCHGGNWVNKWQNVNIKSIGTITVFCMQIALIYYIILRLSSTNYDVSTSFQWENKDLLYPNITICNPRLFDRQKVKEMNLTDELLAYLYLPVTYEHGVFLYPQLEPYYATYEKQLETRDLDVNMLPHLAIKCEDFLSECFTLFKSSARCCGDVFDFKPYFSSLGTCFTTKPIQLVYNNPLDVLGITTNVSTKYSTGINSKTYGAIFAKQAIDLAFHSQDQGLVAINRNSLSFNRGTINKVKLQRVEVDRTLASKTFTLEPTDSDEVASCISNGEEYDLSQDLGWPAWTKANCEFYVSALYLSSCSYMQTIGIESNFFGNEEEIIKQFDVDYERKTCRPLDFMNNSINTTRLDKIAELRKSMMTKCKTVKMLNTFFQGGVFQIVSKKTLSTPKPQQI